MTLVKRNFLAGYTVLIVDDNVDNQDLLTIYLAESGAEIERAANGAEALDIIDMEKFDVIFMDLHMPVMDGHSAAKEIRKTTFAGDLIAVTATSASEIDEILKDNPFDLILRKPISKADFLEQVFDLTD